MYNPARPFGNYDFLREDKYVAHILEEMNYYLQASDEAFIEKFNTTLRTNGGRLESEDLS